MRHRCGHAVKFRTSNGVPGIRVGWVTKKYHMTIMVLDDLRNTDFSYLGFGVFCMSKTEDIKDILTRQEEKKKKSAHPLLCY